MTVTTTNSSRGETTRVDRARNRAANLLERDAVFRDAQPDASVSAAALELCPNLGRIVAEVMTRYADRPALGRRSRDLVTDTDGRTTRKLLPKMETVSYGAVWADAGALATALSQGAGSVEPGDFFATLGFAGVDYVVAELATVRLGAVAVPLQAGAGARRLLDVVAEVGPKVIAADIENLSTAIELAAHAGTVTRVIVLGYDAGVDDERLIDARDRASDSLTVETLPQAIARGRKYPEVASFESDSAERLATLIYTSGSTGTPKGAMHTQQIVSRSWTGAWLRAGNPDDPHSDAVADPAIVLDYLPMSHLAGRSLVFSTLSAGGTVYFAGSSDLSTLFEDFALARPTVAMLIPRVCEMIRHTVLAEVDRRVDVDAADPDAARSEVLAEFRSDTFGGRVLAAVVSTAPIAPEVKSFVAGLLDAPVLDNYGSTEAGMVLRDGVVLRPPVLDYKLQDVPELGYFRTDNPHPRGELLLRTSSITPGYFKRPDVTAEMFDRDGFYRTGDVVAEIEPDRLVYVDRRKNVLKLAQGEFVALSRLESIYGASDLVDQIFVYGNGQRSYLLAVVVPAAGVDSPASITATLQVIARAEGLNSYEIPREVVLAAEPFTTANGLLSGAGKQLRPALTDRYGPSLEQRYVELDNSSSDILRALRSRGADAPVLATVSDAAGALLGCSPDDLQPDARFSDLGGDSLSALTFSRVLRDIFDIDVPVGVITGPSTDLAALAEYISGARDSDSGTATFASTHGRDATEVFAHQLTLETFLDSGALEDASSIPGPRDQTRTVLLTGANGYLGRFLCLDWLERMAAVGGTVVCLVRGRSPEDARRRLEDAFDSGDPQLLSRFRELADRALDIVVGDIGSQRFQLDGPTWDSLAERVDRIVHPAALVNHALPYEHLFGPNVVGTAEVIRLALAHHKKPVTYLSTVAVAAGVEHFVEDGDIRQVSPQRAVDDSYANGYGTSKWAGEVLLRNAFERFGLPVSVFRSDMILAHSTFTGQLNVPDVFTRLVLSVVATGIAPRTFYRLGDGGRMDADGRPYAHYDGLPADFTAAAITSIGADVVSGHRAFDVSNPHDDGISLDTFVDWIIAAGRKIDIIDDYDEWFSRFSGALKGLPDHQRAHSLLPLIHSYESPTIAIAGSHLPTDAFGAAVQSRTAGDIPHLDRALIEKYLSDLEQLELIMPVGRASTGHHSSIGSL